MLEVLTWEYAQVLIFRPVATLPSTVCVCKILLSFSNHTLSVSLSVLSVHFLAHPWRLVPCPAHRSLYPAHGSSCGPGAQHRPLAFAPQPTVHRLPRESALWCHRRVHQTVLQRSRGEKSGRLVFTCLYINVPGSVMSHKPAHADIGAVVFTLTSKDPCF